MPYATSHNTLQAQAKVRVFGSSAALVMEATQHSSGTPTVNIEVASKQGKTVDWQRKLVFQLMPRELPLLAAVLLGQAPHVSFGRDEKGLYFERQGTQVFTSATTREARYALPISAGDVFWCAELVMARLVLGSQSQDSNIVLAAIGGIAVTNAD